MIVKNTWINKEILDNYGECVFIKSLQEWVRDMHMTITVRYFVGTAGKITHTVDFHQYTSHLWSYAEKEQLEFKNANDELLFKLRWT